MGVRAAFGAVFGDRTWFKKVLLAAVITMIPYVGSIAVIGYTLKYQRDVAWGHPEKLPEWNDFGGHIKTGFFAMIVAFVYTLPFVLVVTLAASGTMVAAIVRASDTGSLDGLILVFLVIGAVTMLGSVAMSLILWPVYTQVALYDTIQSGFDYKGIFARVKANAAEYWHAIRGSLILTAISTGIMFVLWGGWFAAFGTSVFASSYSDAPSPAIALLVPAEFLIIAVQLLFTTPIQLANSHIWGGYARSAYDLSDPAAAAAVAVPVEAEPAPGYLPPAPGA